MDWMGLSNGSFSNSAFDFYSSFGLPEIEPVGRMVNTGHLLKTLPIWQKSP